MNKISTSKLWHLLAGYYEQISNKCGALEVPNDACALGRRAHAAAVVARDADAVDGDLVLLHRLDQPRHECLPLRQQMNDATQFTVNKDTFQYEYIVRV